MLKPQTWEEIQCDSCVLINSVNFIWLMKPSSYGACDKLLQNAQDNPKCKFDSVPTWSQIGECFTDADQQCKSFLEKTVSPVVHKACAFDESQEIALKMAIAKLFPDARDGVVEKEAENNGEDDVGSDLKVDLSKNDQERDDHQNQNHPADVMEGGTKMAGSNSD